MFPQFNVVPNEMYAGMFRVNVDFLNELFCLMYFMNHSLFLTSGFSQYD